MIALKRRLNLYAAFAGLIPKLFLAYRGWVWMDLFVNALAMTLFYFFWRAVYAGQTTLAGLEFQQTINYVLLAQIMGQSVFPGSLWRLGRMIRDGQVGIELLRPIDLQESIYVQALTDVVMTLAIKLPLVVLAVVAFNLRLPADPQIWLAFVITLLLGFTAFFMFDFMFACLAFYTTEVWGLSVMRYGVDLFLSGALLPLVMMPDWLRSITLALPFAQVLYVPLSLLSGTQAISAAPSLWLLQIFWIVVLGVLCRWVFNIAVRKVTVQGG